MFENVTIPWDESEHHFNGPQDVPCSANCKWCWYSHCRIFMEGFPEEHVLEYFSEWVKDREKVNSNGR